MKATETPTSIPPELDRITVVLKPQEGSTLNQVRQFAQLGAPVAIGRGLSVIASCCEGDALAKEADDLEPDLVAIIAALQARLDVTDERNDLMAGLLREARSHQGVMLLTDPPRHAWKHHGMDERIAAALQPTTEQSSVVAKSMHIDDRVKMVGSEPAFLTVVFKLPSLNDAQPLIAQLPYGQKALGTEAVVFGMTAGNLMESLP